MPWSRLIWEYGGAWVHVSYGEDRKGRTPLRTGDGPNEAKYIPLAMEPGEELDRATAEYVLGRPFQKPGHGPCCTYQVCGHGFDECLCGLSEDIAAAWQVVEKMQELGCMIELDRYYPGENSGLWTCLFCAGSELCGRAEVPTAPEAICKAALLAVMES